MNTLNYAILAGVSSLAVAAIFLAFWREDKSASWNLHWAISHFCIALALVSGQVYQQFGAAVVFPISVSLSALAVTTMVAGALTFMGRKVTTTWLVVATLLQLVAISLITLVDFTYARLVLVSFLGAGFGIGSGYLWRRGDIYSRLAATILFLRAANAFAFGFTTMSAYRDLALLASQILVLSSGLSLLIAVFAEHVRRLYRIQNDLRDANAALVEAKMTADAANNAKSDFLARMSHELRTPLNAVIGFAEMLHLDSDKNLSAKQKDFSRFIIDGGRHLLNVVNDILDIGPSNRGDLRPIIIAVPVRELFDYVAATMQPVAKEAKIALEVTTPAAPLTLRADSARLRRVLINLVSNAIRYNRPGGTAALSAMQVTGGARVRIVVSDTGVGMDAPRQALLFEPFNWLGPAYTTTGGTGIGLALSRRLVEAMGGAIGFTSEEGHGSTFWVELPAETAPISDSRGADSDAASGTAPQKLEALHDRCLLLYVEDNELSVLFMEGLVSTLAGVTILTATTAEQGLELAASRRPDVIVLDINLPGMNGYEMLGRLKAAPETKDIPVLALSASAMQRDMQRGAASGFLTYFTKPVDVNALTTALHEAIAKAPRRRIDAAD